MVRDMGDDCVATVHPEIYECSGVARSIQSDDGVWSLDTTGPGDCMSAAVIEEKFPGYGTKLLPKTGNWFHSGSSASGGATTPDEDQTRAVRVSRWLHSAELHADIGDDVMVMFMHVRQTKSHAFLFFALEFQGALQLCALLAPLG